MVMCLLSSILWWRWTSGPIWCYPAFFACRLNTLQACGLWCLLRSFGIKAHWYLELEKAMAPHSSTLAWTIPWTEEPDRLQSMGSLRVRQDWATSLSLSCIGEGNGNPLQCSCLKNPRDRGACWAAIYGVAQSRTRLKWLSSSSILGVGMRLRWITAFCRVSGFQGISAGQVVLPGG